MEQQLKTLDEIGEGIGVRVVSILTGRAAQNKLAELCIFEGTILIALRQAPIGGPVLVSAGGREVAIGRNLAHKIKVQVME